MSFEQVRKMRRGVNAFEYFSFPFIDDIKVGFRVLTQAEVIEAESEAKKYCREKYGDDKNSSAVQVIGWHLLQKSCYIMPESGNPTEPFFMIPEDVGEMTIDELNMMLENYNEVQEKYAPLQALNSKEDFDKLIDDIKKKPQTGMSLSSHSLRKLMLYLVSPETL